MLGHMLVTSDTDLANSVNRTKFQTKCSYVRFCSTGTLYLYIMCKGLKAEKVIYLYWQLLFVKLQEIKAYLVITKHAEFSVNLYHVYTYFVDLCSLPSRHVFFTTLELDTNTDSLQHL
jgi:hypothetical protein